MKNSEEMVVSSFAFIFMSVASVAALFLTSEDEVPPPVYIPPTAVNTPCPTGRTFNNLYQTPQDNFEDIDPRVLDRQMQEWVDQQKFQRNPVRFAVEKMWSY